MKIGERAGVAEEELTELRRELHSGGTPLQKPLPS